jgi:hypothetical protein
MSRLQWVWLCIAASIQACSGSSTSATTPISDAVEPTEIVQSDEGPDTPSPDMGRGEDTALDVTDIQDVTTECLSDLDYFESNLWKPTLRVKCFVCHNQDGIANQTDMVLRSDEEPDFLASNFETVKSLAQVDVAGTSLLLLKPTNTHGLGHTGGIQFKVGSTEYGHFEHFVDRISGVIDPCDAPPLPGLETCDSVDPGIRKLRRLTRFEYGRTLQDLLGFLYSSSPEVMHGQDFTTETVVNGFDNNVDAVQVNALFADQVRSTAEKIANTQSEHFSALLPCQPVAGSEVDCAQQFITTFGKRVFRRPLTDDQIARYVSLYNLAADQDGFDEGIELVLSALLQSPHLLYRSEIGILNEASGLYELDAYEIASQLSYLLWGSMPDDELMAAADSGELLDPAEIEKQARRMIPSPKTHRLLAHFAGQWLEIDQLATRPKNTELFPTFTDDIRSALMEETVRFLGHIAIDQKGTLSELFLANYSFINADLATFYNVDAPPDTNADGYGKTSLEGSPYGGLLRHGSLLARHAFPSQSSPIHRGGVVRERMLCQDLPPPPPGIMVQVPELEPGLTTRERFSAHSEQEPCHSCHQLIDPIGFGFEHFDAVGRYRELEQGKPIDVSGAIVNSLSTDGPFEGVGELSTILANSADVHECFALQWFRFGYGLEEDPALACLVTEITNHFLTAGLQIEELLVALTQTPHFTHRQSLPDDDVPPDEPPPVEDVGGPSDAGTTLPPLPDQDLDIDPVTNSDWNTGYCMNVTVKNVGASAVQWMFTMPVQGTITQHWNVKIAPYGEEILFQGVDWNGNLAPGASAEFGFCADK